MKGFSNSIAGLIRASTRAYARKWSFLGLFCIVFFASVLILARFDLLPEASSALGAPPVTLSASPIIVEKTETLEPIGRIELPTSMAIPVLRLAVIIVNPDTTDIPTLDSMLLKGAVRYPTSAKLGETGNVVLFGHSSYLPIVKNQAYKTFNGIQKLVAGDVIIVSSAGTEYTYHVRSVSKEDANDAGIPLSVSGRVLTLSTCDSFGKKTDRFVVVADFVESHLIST